MSRNYSRKTDPVLSDLALIWDAENSDWALTTFSNILALFEASETAATLKEADTEYSAPATGATVSLTDSNTDKHLILTPAATIATLTVTLPAIVRDKQTVLVTSTQIVTTLTIDGNGAAAVNGAPAAFAANGFFTLKYDVTVNSWYRVG